MFNTMNKNLCLEGSCPAKTSVQGPDGNQALEIGTREFNASAESAERESEYRCIFIGPTKIATLENFLATECFFSKKSAKNVGLPH